MKRPIKGKRPESRALTVPHSNDPNLAASYMRSITNINMKVIDI